MNARVRKLAAQNVIDVSAVVALSCYAFMKLKLKYRVHVKLVSGFQATVKLE